MTIPRSFSVWCCVRSHCTLTLLPPFLRAGREALSFDFGNHMPAPPCKGRAPACPRRFTYRLYSRCRYRVCSDCSTKVLPRVPGRDRPAQGQPVLPSARERRLVDEDASAATHSAPRRAHPAPRMGDTPPEPERKPIREGRANEARILRAQSRFGRSWRGAPRRGVGGHAAAGLGWGRCGPSPGSIVARRDRAQSPPW